MATHNVRSLEAKASDASDMTDLSAALSATTLPQNPPEDLADLADVAEAEEVAADGGAGDPGPSLQSETSDIGDAKLETHHEPAELTPGQMPANQEDLPASSTSSMWTDPTGRYPPTTGTQQDTWMFWAQIPNFPVLAASEGPDIERLERHPINERHTADLVEAMLAAPSHHSGEDREDREDREDSSMMASPSHHSGETILYDSDGDPIPKLVFDPSMVPSSLVAAYPDYTDDLSLTELVPKSQREEPLWKTVNLVKGGLPSSGAMETFQVSTRKRFKRSSSQPSSCDRFWRFAYLDVHGPVSRSLKPTSTSAPPATDMQLRRCQDYAQVHLVATSAIVEAVVATGKFKLECEQCGSADVAEWNW